MGPPNWIALLVYLLHHIIARHSKVMPKLLAFLLGVPLYYNVMINNWGKSITYERNSTNHMNKIYWRIDVSHGIDPDTSLLHLDCQPAQQEQVVMFAGHNYVHDMM